MCVTGRWYLCRLCQSLVVVCSSCDRGHAYCSRACSTEGRARNRRAARRRYAQTQRGRETGRARQRRYRLAMAERERGSAQAAVTASADGSGDDGGPVIDPAIDTEEETVTDHSSGRPVRSHIRAFPAQSGRTASLRCAACGRTVSRLMQDGVRQRRWKRVRERGHGDR